MKYQYLNVTYKLQVISYATSHQYIQTHQINIDTGLTNASRIESVFTAL